MRQCINQKGQALVMLLIFAIIGIMVTSASVALIISNAHGSDKLYQGATAYDVAESGAETAMIKLLRNPNYAGEIVTVGTGQAEITVASSGATVKTVTSKGTIGGYTRKVQVIADYSGGILTATSWKEIQ
jgi:hypothetical protein